MTEEKLGEIKENVKVAEEKLRLINYLQAQINLVRTSYSLNVFNEGTLNHLKGPQSTWEAGPTLTIEDYQDIVNFINAKLEKKVKQLQKEFDQL